jgi:hypothetical protein
MNEGMSSQLSWQQGRADHCCGIIQLYGFNFYEDATPARFFDTWDKKWVTPKDTHKEPAHPDKNLYYASKTGLYEASFINEEASKKAYEKLCKDLVLLYQSPVRVNKSTGNKVFMCIFSSKERNRKR